MSPAKAAVSRLCKRGRLEVRPGMCGTGLAPPAERAKHTDADEEVHILNTIERWVDRELKPIVKEYDHEDRYPDGVVEQMKEFGLFGAVISPDYGGLGLSAATYAPAMPFASNCRRNHIGGSSASELSSAL